MPSAPPRKPFVYALAACSALALAASLVPSRDERTQRELRRVLSSGLRENIRRTDFPDSRVEFLSLLRRLQEQGDERGIRSLAPVILGSNRFTAPELGQALDVDLHDIETWNTALPEWKWELLEKWRNAADPLRSSLAGRLSDSAPVTFAFRAPPGKYPRLFLSGSWNGRGEIDDLFGWKDAPMRYESGRWTRTEKLRVTRFFHPFHAVVRTAPWPRGITVGHIAFSAPANGEVVIQEDAGLPGPERASIAPEQGMEPAAAKERGTRSKPSVRVAVAILDGATWQVILPLVHRGLLPNFARLLRESATTRLTSSGQWYPSEPNIYGALTGKLAFRHGVTDYFALSSSLRASPLWQMAADRGKSTVVVSVPNTFPPQALPSGKLVSDLFFAVRARQAPHIDEAAKSAPVVGFATLFGVSQTDIERMLKLVNLIAWSTDTTHPSALAEQLSAALPPADLRAELGVAGITELFDLQILRALEILLRGETVDFLCAYLQSTDAAAHTYWNDFEPSDLARPGPLLDIYQRADRMVGLLLDHAENIIVFSDHGDGPAGYHPIERLNPYKLLDEINRALGKRFQEEVTAESKGERWMFSIARHEDTGRFASELAAFLRNAEYLPSGQAMFSGIETRTESKNIKVSFTQEQPHPALVNGVQVQGRHYAALQFFDLSPLQGIHMGNGILAIKGPGVRPGSIADTAYISDVAPTALYLLGLPLAKDMDGRLAEAAFEPRRLAADPPRFIESYGSAGSGWWRLLRSIRWRRLLTSG